MYELPTDRWPNQVRAFNGILDAMARGVKRLCVTSPTGTGKTFIIMDMVHYARSASLPWILYTQRKMLFEQICRDFDAEGISYGKRASGYREALLRDGQIAMVQTEKSRVMERATRDLHRAKIVLVDEAHQFNSPACQALLKAHEEAGAIVVLITATPLDMVGVDELLVAGTVSEGRNCGALVCARTVGCDEPDLKYIRKYAVGEDLSAADNHEVIMRPGVFGRVLDNWKLYNRDQKATLLFGPDVKGSLFFAQEFCKAGIRAAHIDGEDVWLDGEYYTSDQEIRDKVLALSASGDVKIICNRFVLREGLNLPWIECGIFATVFGSLTSFLQSGGRLLRACPSRGKKDVLILDHGGNWHRGFGSLNDDRDWSLGMTNHVVVGEKIERMRGKQEPEPICCPNCKMIRRGGKQCLACGYVAHKGSRVVVQKDGTLRPIDEEIFKQRRVKSKPNTESAWKKIYYRARSKRWNATFRQAEAMFFREERYWPPRDLPLMPKSQGDWCRKVSDVPYDNLIGSAMNQPAAT